MFILPVSGPNRDVCAVVIIAVDVVMLYCFYSIEDAKQKAEHDKMIAMAEEKKAGVRQTIQTLRDQFQMLIEKNDS